MNNAEKATVLLVDDDSIFTDVIANRLRREGMVCEYASQGSLALNLLAKGLRPSVVLLDIVMPDMSGFEVLAKLKADPKTASLPVIVFSNESNPDNKRKAREFGAVEFLEKVLVTPSEVVEAIRKWIPS